MVTVNTFLNKSRKGETAVTDINFYQDKNGKWHFKWFMKLRGQWMHSGSFPTKQKCVDLVNSFFKNDWKEV